MAKQAGPDSNPALAAISYQVEEAAKLSAQIEQLEDDLKQAKKALYVIERERLPEMLSEAGLTEITAHGYKVTIQPIVEGGLPKEDLERREKALDWIAKHDGEELIKTEVTLRFGKGDAKIAAKAEAVLKKAGFAPEVGRNIHPQTLFAWVRERLREGAELAPDIIGVTVGTIARVRQGKTKK